MIRSDRWENVRLDLYIFEYLFINKIFEMKKISLNDIYFLTYLIDGKTFVWIYIFLNEKNTGEKNTKKRTGKKYGKKYEKKNKGKSTEKIYVEKKVRGIFEYLFINKIFEMKNISLNDIFFF
jgi:hypothetical protein